MGRQQSQNDPFGLNDYDQPTEPMERIVFPVQTRPGYPPDNSQPPAPFAPASTYPYPPQENWPAFPYAAPQYPILPAAPGGTYSGESGKASPSYKAQRTRRYRRSPVPGLVGLLFVLAQAVLLGRVLCLFFSVNPTSPWLGLLFTVSDFLVWPASRLAANIKFSLLQGTQLLLSLEFLLSILAYGLVSRIVVRILKMLLNA